MAPTAVIYCRISRDREGAGLGVERQLQDCRELAQAHGFTVVGEHTDNDLSAYSGKPRPGYVAACEALKHGTATAILAWHPDRITRHPRELEDFIDLLDATGAKVLTCRAGEYDLATPTGKTFARIVGAMATGESEHKSDRLKRKAKQLAESGSWHGGTRPFGYAMPEARIIPAEAKAVRQAKMILNGESVRAVTRAWNEAGITTVKGNVWLPQVVRRTMLNPYLAGRRTHQGKDIGEAAWKPILDLETWEHVKAILTTPERTTNKSFARKHVLSGFLFCGKCGTKLMSAKVNGKPAYSCKKDSNRTGCGALTVNAEPVEAMVRALVIQRIADADNVKPTKVTGSTEEAQSDLDALEAVKGKLERLENVYINGTMNQERYDGLRVPLEAELHALESRLSQLRDTTFITTLPKDVDTLNELWDTQGLDWRRAVVGAVIDRVTVKPAAHRGERFNPDRIVPKLR